jgi:hypothetical protein
VRDVSASKGVGEVARQSGIRINQEHFVVAQPATGSTTVRQPNGERGMFTSVADLRILSAALALFIANMGRRVREKPENPVAIRARQLMDHIDDGLHLTLVKSPGESQPPKHV